MPNTRASTRRRLATPKHRENTTISNNVQDYAETSTSIKDNLREARLGVEKLFARIQSLERENESLRCELQRNQQSSAGSRSGSSNKASRREVRSLERTIVDLKAAREKDRRTIKKLRNKEVEQDARELANDDHETIPTSQQADLGESAIKFLRRVCDTIDMNSLAEGEECAVCMEQMEVRRCYSLQCRHPLCMGCFDQLCNAANTIPDDIQSSSLQCPHCRERCERDDCDIITHTAVQQWDLLLDISKQWSEIDIGEIDIEGDDDDEVSFIDDGSIAARESPCTPENLEEATDLEPDQDASAAPTSVDDAGSAAYKSLPSPLKRKRLTELVAQRAVKSRK